MPGTWRKCPPAPKLWETRPCAAWMSGWTIFYWAWWCSWTPFVGMFIARISRGRTIRQFVTGVLLVPSVVSVIWFGIFGGTAFGIQQEADKTENPADGLAKMVDGVPTISFDGALFDLVKNLHMPAWAHHRSDHTGHGARGDLLHHRRRLGLDRHGLAELQRVNEPRRGLVIFWGLLTGGVAAVMLLAGGDEPSEALSGLQITIVAALPFVLVMLLLCVAWRGTCARDPLALRARLATTVVERAIRTGVDQHGGVQFDLVTSMNVANAVVDAPAPAVPAPTPATRRNVTTTLEAVPRVPQRQSQPRPPGRAPWPRSARRSSSSPGLPRTARHRPGSHVTGRPRLRHRRAPAVR